ncbi:MAG: thiamine pyrophosphate-dependent dehydrogenase E1 component subunit alpha [Promethearchaeota archaeon]
MELEKMKLLDFYANMFTIRRFEEKSYELLGTTVIPGTLHTYMGEEAIAVGVCAHLSKEDYITSTHRGHGHCIAKGASIDKMFAELFSKETGYCKSKGGSMHIADFDIGILGANGVVGGGIPIATGAGLTCKLKYNNERVCVCFFGDGASNQGTFHEAINLAAVWKLPVIFVCENNLYAMGTPQSTVMAIENIADRAVGYGIPGIVVDGNDVLEIYNVAGDAINRARNGDGPTLIECKTYRIKGHSRYDPAKYRPVEEAESWFKRDPLKILKIKMLEKNIPEEEIIKIEAMVEEEIQKAVDYAMESPFPPVEDALKDVYAGE